jgi:integrase
MKKRPPHVSLYRDRHGKVRSRFRKPGLPESQTTAPWGSHEWLIWYNAALEGEKRPVGESRTVPGSIGSVIVAYYSSHDWRSLAATTQATYRGIIERFRVKHGDKPARRLEAAHIRKILDGFADRPAAAGNLLKVLRVLMRFAVDRGYVVTDPTIGVRPPRYRSDGFHTWSDAEVEGFEKRWPLGTRERLALDLLLYTAQRSGDVRKLGRQHVKDGVLTVRQEKTGAVLQLPLDSRLKASLAACKGDNLTFLVTQHGKPYTAKGFGNWFSDAAQKAGLPVGASAHGLRKTAATRLAEAGCSVHELAAWTGHSTLKELQRYTKAASQKQLAESAMRRAGKTKMERKLSNQANRLGKSGGK